MLWNAVILDKTAGSYYLRTNHTGPRALPCTALTFPSATSSSLRFSNISLCCTSNPPPDLALPPAPDSTHKMYTRHHREMGMMMVIEIKISGGKRAATTAP